MTGALSTRSARQRAAEERVPVQSALPLFASPEALVRDPAEREAAPTPLVSAAPPEAPAEATPAPVPAAVATPAAPRPRPALRPVLREPVRPEPSAPETMPLDAARALVPGDFRPASRNPLDGLLRLAYRAGVPGALLAAPLRKPGKLRLLGTPASALKGDRVAGTELRTGYLMVHGARLSLDALDLGAHAHLPLPVARAVHGFGWLRDLAAAAPRSEGAAIAGPLLARWLAASGEPGKGQAWSVEFAGRRLLAWLTHAPLVLAGAERQRAETLAAIEAHARWLDKATARAEDRLAQVAGWAAITAAGLLLPDGRPRRVFGEAGLLRALGELVGEDGGVLSRSPLAQIDAVSLLIDLRACYEAARRAPPPGLATILSLMIPPLLALRMGDGGTGCWQGAGAITPDALVRIVAASGVRTRPLKEPRAWGYHRLSGGKSLLVMDAAPPPAAKCARVGCASTLAFEFAHATERLIVNCGGAEYAGTQVPARIEQGLRGTAAHSTLVLEDANSTAVLLAGKLGKGVAEVDVRRGAVVSGKRHAHRIEASHDGYAARYGLIHRRILLLADDGLELRGEDLLEPSSRKGKRGKIGFAIRFHLAPGIAVHMAEDGRGAALALPDGSHWQFRLAAASGDAALSVEDSLWVDGHGRVSANRQLVVEGKAARSGGRFPWLLKRMG